ncbi:MAG TPA: hypothetical protein VNU21_10725 [Usitatibacter sp.]|nr:hypothetical protein [Usitatibacter sp.]
MDRATVFTKTAKGITQVNQRSASLPKDLMKVLKLIDGKSNFGQLMDRADIEKAPLEIALTKLTRDGFARVFETRKDEFDFGGEEDDFDFTSLKKGGGSGTHPGTTQRVMPSASNDVGELARQQERADVDRKAREATERRIREEAHEAARLKAKTEAEARAKLEAEARAKQQAEERAMEQARRAREAAERAKVELEAKMREEEARRRAFAEQQARLTAEQKAREEVEGRRLAELRAKAEAEAQALAEARARAEAEAQALARARAEAEAAARRKAEEASNAEIELKARLKDEIEARIRTEMEELLRNEIGEKARAEMHAQIMAEAKLAARAELEERLREERGVLAAAEQVARVRADADARERADHEAKLRAEAEARAAAESEARMRAEADARHAREEAQASAREQAETARRLDEERRGKMEAEARVLAETQERERRERELSAEKQEREKRERELSAEKQEREKRERELSAEKQEREKRERELSAEKQAREKRERELSAEKQERDKRERELAADLQQREKRERELAAEVQERERRERELSAEMHQRDKREKALSAAVAAERRAKETIAEDVRVQVQAELEADLGKRAEIEGKAQAKAYMEARAKAEEAEEQRLRDEQARKAREIAEILRTKSEAEPDAAAAQKPLRRRVRSGPGIVKAAFYGVAALFILVVGLLHVVPLRPYAAKIERSMSAWLHDDVAIGSATFRLWPTPHLNVENIAVGKLLDAKAVHGRIYMDLTTLFGQQPAINALEFDDVSIASSAVKRIPLWAQEQGKDAAGGIDSIVLRNVKLDVKPGVEPLSAVRLAFSRKGRLLDANISSTGGWTARLKPGQGGTDVELTARNATLPVGVPLTVTEATLKGKLADGTFLAPDFEATAFGGKLAGAIKVTWGDRVRFESDFTMHRVNAQELLPPFTRDIAVTGHLDGDFKVVAESATPETLFEAPRVHGKFRLTDGTISNVDLVAVMQATDTAQRAGVTRFVELSGEYGAADRHSNFRQVNLQGGVLRGSGTIDVAPNSALNGRATLEIRSQVAQDRGAFAVSGTVSRPVMRRGG